MYRVNQLHFRPHLSQVHRLSERNWKAGVDEGPSGFEKRCQSRTRTQDPVCSNSQSHLESGFVSDLPWYVAPGFGTGRVEWRPIPARTSMEGVLRCQSAGCTDKDRASSVIWSRCGEVRCLGCCPASASCLDDVAESSNPARQSASASLCLSVCARAVQATSQRKGIASQHPRVSTVISD